MALESRADIKARLIPGYTLTAQDMANIADSFWHLEDSLPKEIVYLSTLDPLPSGQVNTLYVVKTGNDRGIYDWTSAGGFASLANVTAGGGGGAGIPSTQSYAPTGITLRIDYWGTTEPVVSGVDGTYNVSLPDGTRLKSIYLKAVDKDAATTGDHLIFTISSANNREEFTSYQITDLSDNKKVVNEKERGIDVTEVGNDTNQVTNTFTNIRTGTNGFAIMFT